MPICVGIAAVCDGSHFEIIRPAEWEQDYVNFKGRVSFDRFTRCGVLLGWHSQNVLGMCDYDRRLLWVRFVRLCAR